MKMVSDLAIMHEVTNQRVKISAILGTRVVIAVAKVIHAEVKDKR
jgi:hypothetical protein